MDDPWEKAYVYTRNEYKFSKVAHVWITSEDESTLCGIWAGEPNRTPKPYPVCRNCLRTKRAKELGLLDGAPWLGPIPRNEDLP